MIGYCIYENDIVQTFKTLFINNKQTIINNQNDEEYIDEEDEHEDIIF